MMIFVEAISTLRLLWTDCCLSQWKCASTPTREPVNGPFPSLVSSEEPICTDPAGREKVPAPWALPA